LTQESKLHIQRHLDECPPCYEQFDFEAELRIVIARKCAERVPDALKERIAQALENEVGQA
jgi:mycothiol system anti-sigma-R factor